MMRFLAPWPQVAPPADG